MTLKPDKKINPETNNPQETEYGAGSIKVLEGLEAVRKRPAMYIGSTGPQGLHHLVYEVVDNSVDEALAGYADNVKVILHSDGSCSVEDNGRGIPTDIHPTEKVSAAEVVMTKLHAGGKFDKKTYKYSGGLHGVGISVVNALSKKLYLEIYQKGKIFAQTYEYGKPVDKLKEIGETTKRGTLVRFTPDPEIFQETVDFDFDTLAARLRELAFLNKGLRISIFDERSAKQHEFYFEGGIISFVESINSKKTPLFPEIIYCHKDDNINVLEFAMQYNDGYGEQLFSFVNNINTIDGGTHVTGFKAALTKACNKKAQEFHIVKEGEAFSSEDVREGLVCVINLKVPEPQFEGQTKTKLGNSEIKGIVESWASACLETFFEENPAIAKKILQKAQIAKEAREAAKKARELTRRKSVLEFSVLPGKLADCSSEKPTDTELFIVEGDSAGGSAKSARDRHIQAILPLRGKILNVEKARFDKILANEEIKNLITAIGCGIGEEFNAERARYHKIILMTDADVDGAHIRTLLLTFFFRYMRPLVDLGYLYIAQPPLYKAKIGKKEEYLKDDKAFAAFLISWAKEQTKLSIHDKSLPEQQWSELLDELTTYRVSLEDVAKKYKLSSEQVHELVKILHEKKWTNTDEIESLVPYMQEQFPGYGIDLVHQEETETAAKRSYISFKQLKREWQLNIQFFFDAETFALINQFDSLATLTEKWNLTVVDKNVQVESKGILKLLQAISKISKPYMSVQRYKGLGEMNPEQLWETAMDPKIRNLLQVKIGDALEADSWFDTLMGDDVTGRKIFIEEYGQFVKNLDV
ncbi:DNA topoisomerase (ATP-hydrolyzing) subunit B [Candidatus Dependentiae bacterium]|nr:DNA topoisomerase (ATP-hydrolyzing) subunit B [Candidatus Dependentiae bacterium]